MLIRIWTVPYEFDNCSSSKNRPVIVIIRFEDRVMTNKTCEIPRTTKLECTVYLFVFGNLPVGSKFLKWKPVTVLHWREVLPGHKLIIYCLLLFYIYSLLLFFMEMEMQGHTFCYSWSSIWVDISDLLLKFYLSCRKWFISGTKHGSWNLNYSGSA